MNKKNLIIIVVLAIVAIYTRRRMKPVGLTINRVWTLPGMDLMAVFTNQQTDHRGSPCFIFYSISSIT